MPIPPDWAAAHLKIRHFWKHIASLVGPAKAREILSPAWELSQDYRVPEDQRKELYQLYQQIDQELGEATKWSKPSTAPRKPPAPA